MENRWDLSKLGVRDHLASAPYEIDGYGDMLAGGDQTNARVSSDYHHPLVFSWKSAKQPESDENRLPAMCWAQGGLPSLCEMGISKCIYTPTAKFTLLSDTSLSTTVGPDISRTDFFHPSGLLPGACSSACHLSVVIESKFLCGNSI